MLYEVLRMIVSHWISRLTPSIKGATLALMSLLMVTPLTAQELRSSAPIRIVVPYGPGGPTDVVARLLSVPMQNMLKQPVIVENRAGAGSLIGARVVAGAPADGHTILLGNVSTFAIAPAITKNPGYDPTKAFVPIVQTTDIGMVMVAAPNFPANNLQEFIAYAKANPGKVTYGSAGIGNSAHLLAELLQAKANLNMIHVPYKSGAEMSMAVVSGQVQFAMTDLSASLGQIREGKLKALAMTGVTRSAELTQVPTMIESGYPDIVLRNWTGAAAPAGTPPAIVKKLQSVMNEVIKSPEYQAAIAKMGGEAKPGNPEELGALIASDFKRWGDVAKAAGVVLD
jgi:tripartite-type tricarboxylate transporter receptor subunit TctC